MAQTLLGFDFGSSNIGVAVGNTVTGTADPLVVIPSEPLARRWSAIGALVEQWRPGRLVVGRPAWPEAGKAGEANTAETAARCERFARQLAGRYRLPVEFVDESGSSLAAAAALGARRRKRGTAPGPDDAEAAAIILRQYLSNS